MYFSIQSVFDLRGSIVRSLLPLAGAAWVCGATSSSFAENPSELSSDKPIAFIGARILTGEGAVFDPGTMIVEGGKIKAVGLTEVVKTPDGSTVVDAKNQTIIPGLVDSHSHLGLFSRIGAGGDGNEGTGPVQSQLHARDAVNPFDPAIISARSGGVTTANIMPGSANAIGGQTVYVKLRGATIEEMRVEAKDGVLGGLKMANGENPKRAYGGKNLAPATRMKIASLQRTEFTKAREYLKKLVEHQAKIAKGEKSTAPTADLSLEPIVEVLKKKRTVHFHSHRADDIMTTLRLKDEFDFELVVQHGTEAYRVADQLAKRQVPVSMTVPDSPGGKAEVADFIEACGAALERAGVKVVINTDDPVTESRFLLRTAAIAVRGGLSEESALKAITLYPAQVMHLDHRLGSLAVGKDADFVILSGSPFSVYTRTLATYIDGRRLFDAANEVDRRFQQGGYALLEPTRAPPASRPIEPSRPVKAPEIANAENDVKKDPRELVVIAGRLHTSSAVGSINDGVVHIKNGRIEFVGHRANFAIPKSAMVRTAVEATAGLIDPYTMVPLTGMLNISADQDSDETTDPNQAELGVIDGFHPQEPLLDFLKQQGVTLVHVCPGRNNVVAGRTGVFRTHGRTVDAMTVRFPQAMLFNFGESPKKAYPGKRPSTRMASAAIIRSALHDAREYGRKQREAKDSSPAPDKNLKHEALAPTLEGKLPSFLIADRADDVVTALRIAREFNLTPILGSATESYLAIDLINERKTPVILHASMQRPDSLESVNTSLGTAAFLKRAGVKGTIGTGFEGYVPKTRVVRFEAAIAMSYGLGFNDALKAITIDAAEILGVADRFGSIEKGKVADVVLYDGDPFEYKTKVTQVIMNGVVVFDRAANGRINLERTAVMFGGDASGCCLGF